MSFSIFNDTLANFTFETNSGGAIRHLADLGYTVQQIVEKLDYPVPYERVQKAVWKHLIENDTILLEEPGGRKQQEKVSYVVDYDKYGRKSLRQVKIKEGESSEISWKEYRFEEVKKDSLTAFLTKKCLDKEIKQAYVSCDFGIESLESLQVLDWKQKEYIQGLPWEKKRVYHCLDNRMREIICSLYENGWYHGICYFMEYQEKVEL